MPGRRVNLIERSYKNWRRSLRNSLGKMEIPDQWDRSGLPAWTYFNKELFDLETEVLFRRHWQLACHQSDLPEPGSYVCFDLCGERAVILRGADGVIRTFHNVCRHRGSRVAIKTKGQCRSALVCPFHGWRSEEHTSELQSLMRISYAVFCLKKKTSQIYLT